LDLSQQSRIRTSLRHRLLDRLDARKARSMPKERLIRPFSSRQAMIVVAILIIVVATSLLFSPSAQAAASALYHEILDFFRIGEHTYAVQTGPADSEPAESGGMSQFITPVGTDESVAYWDGHWAYITIFGTMGSQYHASSGQRITFHSDLESTLAAANHPLRADHPPRLPGYIPAGFSFAKGVVAPDGNWVFLIYAKSPDNYFMIMQAVNATDDTVSFGGECPVRRLTIDGVEYALIGEDCAGSVLENGSIVYNLGWEVNNETILISWIDLPVDEIVRISQSMK
jgi:hypothetical protein